MKRTIRDVINDDDYWERRFAISAAHKSKDVDALIQALADPDHRWKGAKFLGQLGDRRAVRPLTRLLDASDPIVRSCAATALGKIGSPEPVQRLLDITENDPVLAVRLWAIEAMGIIGDKTVAARLARLLDDAEPRTRALSAEALGRIGATSSIDAIRQRRSGQRWGLRRRYSRALRTLARELKRT